VTDCTPSCGTSRCDVPFSVLRPYPTLNFGVRISWDLRPDFTQPGPYSFQLQVGRTGLNTADDWLDVGSPVVDGYHAYDDEKRVYGADRWTHYRVVMTDGNSVEYISRPLHVAAAMKPANLHRIRAVQRFWRQRQTTRAGGPGLELYVLKRRLYGDACATCADYQTGEPTDGNCPECYGTKISGGYFAPEGCVFGELDLRQRRTAVDEQLQAGTVGTQTSKIKLLAEPYLMQNDVLVAAKSDDRYYVHRVWDEAMIEGVSVMIGAEIRLANYNDVIYSLEIPAQVP
jgi:hypothetical protein